MNRSQCNSNQTETINSARLFVWGMVILFTAVFLSGCATFSHAADFNPYQGNDYYNNNDFSLDHEQDYRHRSNLDSEFTPTRRHRSNYIFTPSQRHRENRPVSDELRIDDYEARLKQLLSGNDISYDRPQNRYREFNPRQRYSTPEYRSRDTFQNDFDSQKLRELIRELQQQSLPQYDRDRYETDFPNQIPLDPNQELRARISKRYNSSSAVATLQSLDPQRAYSFYLEVNRMIDSRHVQPPSYDVRTKKSLQNLILAVEDQNFMRVNRISASPQQIRMAQNRWQQLIDQSAARSAQDAVTILRQAADVAGSQLQMQATGVIYEFAYGSLDALDKHSRFEFTPSSSGPRVDAGNNNIVGVGVQLKTHRDGAVILRTLNGGSAERAGLRRGDVIIGVNQRSLAGLSLDEVANLITGPAGSSVAIEVRRDSRTARMNLSRQAIRITNISEVKMVDSEQKIGLVRLEKFGEGAVQELDQALWNLHRQGMKSLIFDLRGNPGGLLTEAIAISNRFVPSGKIVSTRGRNQSDNTVESATHQQTWKIPLVVLVDGDSASASEIFAAAVQENRRGIIVGRKTYGKGTVQTHFPFQTVSGTFWLTTAKFYSPNGREMAGVGVNPDIAVNMSERELEEIGPVDRDLQEGINTIRSQRPGELVNNLSSNPQASPVRFQFSG